MAKKFILFLCSIIIVVISFLMPKVFLQIEDLSTEKEVFSIPKKESKIDVQAEKIYLVRFFHDIYELERQKVYDSKSKKVAFSVPMTQHSDNTELSEELKKEIEKLISNDIIKEINYEEILDYYEVSKTFSSDYTVITYDIVSEDEGIGIGIEKKTGKIVSITFPKKCLKNDVSKRKQLENYAKYLDLDIIDDWVYEEQVLKSEKAQLFIVLEERYDVCELTIAPMENYDEYLVFKNEYEIVESKKEN